MKLFFLLGSLFLLSAPAPSWNYDLDQAFQKAGGEHKYVLLNFSGSDWCAPCIRMHEEIFNTTEFQEMAARKLVLVNADFPRKKKNQLPELQQQKNDLMASRYNKNGNFPFTVLLDPDGKVIKTWEGFYSGGATAFTQLIDQLTPVK